MNRNLKNWNGQAVVGNGFGIFRGIAGDTGVHSHWAVQLTICLDGFLTLDVRGQRLSSQVVVIGAGVPHKLFPANVLSIYVEPKSPYFSALAGTGSLEKDIICLKHSDMVEWLRRATTVSDCAQVGELLVTASDHLRGAEDTRFSRAVTLLQDSLRRGDPLSREQLAHLLGFSPSRFSHWFKEQAGLSFKSYRKWQKLRLSLEALLDGETLAKAAYSGGFADQAHLSRSFVAAFGITFGQAAIALSQK